MQIFDTHSHYNLEPLYSQNDSSLWQTAWQEAQAHGLVGSVVVGTDIPTSQYAIALANQETAFGAAIGIHPGEYYDVDRSPEKDVDTLTRLDDPKMVAIGETGLDYFRFDGMTTNQIEVSQTKQQQALRLHLQLATHRKLPALLHVRDKTETAYLDVLQILKEEQFAGEFVLHCVSGPLTYVQEALSRGAYVSVAGNVTYKTADHIRTLVSTTPPDHLLVETDAPFLPPVPFRGQPCAPWMISKTVEFLQTELAVDPEQLLKNSYRLFPTLQPRG